MDSTQELANASIEIQTISSSVVTARNGRSCLDGRSREEIAKIFHDVAASNPEIRRKYNERKLAAEQYAKYSALENGLMSKYPIDFLLAELQQKTIMSLTRTLKVCLKDIEFLEERLESMEVPYLKKLFDKDQKVLKTLLVYKECRSRREQMLDRSLWRRIKVEDVIWSAWNDGYRSPEDRPTHAGSIVNERRIYDFERDLRKILNRRDILRQEVRQYEVRAISEAAEKFINRKYGSGQIEKEGRFKSILIKKRIKEGAAIWSEYKAKRQGISMLIRMALQGRDYDAKLQDELQQRINNRSEADCEHWTGMEGEEEGEEEGGDERKGGGEAVRGEINEDRINILTEVGGTLHREETYRQGKIDDHVKMNSQLNVKSQMVMGDRIEAENQIEVENKIEAENQIETQNQIKAETQATLKDEKEVEGPEETGDQIKIDATNNGDDVPRDEIEEDIYHECLSIMTFENKAKGGEETTDDVEEQEISCEIQESDIFAIEKTACIKISPHDNVQGENELKGRKCILGVANDAETDASSEENREYPVQSFLAVEDTTDDRTEAKMEEDENDASGENNDPVICDDDVVKEMNDDEVNLVKMKKDDVDEEKTINDSVNVEEASNDEEIMGKTNDGYEHEEETNDDEVDTEKMTKDDMDVEEVNEKVDMGKTNDGYIHEEDTNNDEVDVEKTSNVKKNVAQGNGDDVVMGQTNHSYEHEEETNDDDGELEKTSIGEVDLEKTDNDDVVMGMTNDGYQHEEEMNDDDGELEKTSIGEVDLEKTDNDNVVMGMTNDGYEHEETANKDDMDVEKKSIVDVEAEKANAGEMDVGQTNDGNVEEEKTNDDDVDVEKTNQGDMKVEEVKNDDVVMGKVNGGYKHEEMANDDELNVEKKNKSDMGVEETNEKVDMGQTSIDKVELEKANEDNFNVEKKNKGDMDVEEMNERVDIGQISIDEVELEKTKYNELDTQKMNNDKLDMRQSSNGCAGEEETTGGKNDEDNKCKRRRKHKGIKKSIVGKNPWPVYNPRGLDVIEEWTTTAEHKQETMMTRNPTDHVDDQSRGKPDEIGAILDVKDLSIVNDESKVEGSNVGSANDPKDLVSVLTERKLTSVSDQMVVRTDESYAEAWKELEILMQENGPEVKDMDRIANQEDDVGSEQNGEVASQEDCNDDRHTVCTAKEENGSGNVDHGEKRAIQDCPYVESNGSIAFANVSRNVCLSNDQDRDINSDVITAEEGALKCVESNDQGESDGEAPTRASQDQTIKNGDWDRDIDDITKKKEGKTPSKEQGNNNQAAALSMETLRDNKMLLIKDTELESGENEAHAISNNESVDDSMLQPLLPNDGDCDTDIEVTTTNKGNLKCGEEGNNNKEEGRAQGVSDGKAIDYNIVNPMISNDYKTEKEIIGQRFENYIKEKSSFEEDDRNNSANESPSISCELMGETSNGQRRSDSDASGDFSQITSVSTADSHSEEDNVRVEKSQVIYSNNWMKFGHERQSVGEKYEAASELSVKDWGMMIAGEKPGGAKGYGDDEQNLENGCQEVSTETDEDWNDRGTKINERYCSGSRKYETLCFKAAGSLNYIRNDRDHYGDDTRRAKQSIRTKSCASPGGKMELKGAISNGGFHYPISRKKSQCRKKWTTLKWRTLLTADKNAILDEVGNDTDMIEQGRMGSGAWSKGAFILQSKKTTSLKRGRDGQVSGNFIPAVVLGMEDSRGEESDTVETGTDKAKSDTSVSENENQKDTRHEGKAALLKKNEGSWGTEKDGIRKICGDNSRSYETLNFKAAGSLKYNSSCRKCFRDRGLRVGEEMKFKGGIDDEDFCTSTTKQKPCSRNKPAAMRWRMTLAARTKPQRKKNSNKAEIVNRSGATDYERFYVAQGEEKTTALVQEELASTAEKTPSSDFEGSAAQAMRNGEAATALPTLEAQKPIGVNNKNALRKGLVVSIISGFTYLLKDKPLLTKAQKRQMKRKQIEQKGRLIKEAEKLAQLQKTKSEILDNSGNGNQAGKTDKEITGKENLDAGRGSYQMVRVEASNPSIERNPTAATPLVDETPCGQLKVSDNNKQRANELRNEAEAGSSGDDVKENDENEREVAAKKEFQSKIPKKKNRKKALKRTRTKQQQNNSKPANKKLAH